jgi:hypothetical protein
VGGVLGAGFPNLTTPKVASWPLNCAPGAGSWEQTCQLLWMMTRRCRPLMSLAVMLVLDGSEATATLRLLPVRSGIAWPSDMGEGDAGGAILATCGVLAAVLPKHLAGIFILGGVGVFLVSCLLGAATGVRASRPPVSRVPA